MKRFRFSLLSLLVGVLLLSIVLGANLTPTESVEHKSVPVAISGEQYLYADHVIQDTAWGWPMQARTMSSGEFGAIEGRRMPLSTRLDWHWPHLAANIAIGLAIVFVGASVCEYMVRRLKKTEA